MKLLIEREIFAFIPLGGSVVILHEFYNTVIGKYGAGIEVKNSLKSLCISLLLFYNSSIYFSRSGIHVFAKWQFSNKIHSPSSFPFLINLFALTP